MKKSDSAKELSWQEAFIKYFKMIELRVRLGMIMTTPAVEIKKLAMEKVLKEMEALGA